MDFDRLTLLRELADRGTITAVAKATHRTPSAISQQLKLLEHEAGTRLIEQVGRGVRLTDAGQILARGQHEMQVAMEHMRAQLDDFIHESAGQVVVSTFPSAGQMIMPGVVERMKAYPGIDLECVDLDVSDTDAEKLLLEYHIVLAFTALKENPWTAPNLVVVQLLWEPIDVAIPVGHRLADRPTLTPQDLVGERWIGVPEGYPFDVLLHRVIEANGDAPRVRYRFQDNRVVASFVSAGHGIAFLPRYTSQPGPSERFLLKPITGIASGRYIVALLRSDHAERSAVRRVLSAIRAEAQLLTYEPRL